MDFPEYPVTLRQVERRKRIYGVGINDAPYIVQPTVGGRVRICPIYRAWANMLQRAACELYREKYPAYAGASVCTEWLRFSAFREWMLAQPWEGNSLDKDLLVPGNLHYSPATCVFISAQVNSALIEGRKDNGLPAGVDRHMGAYRASGHGKYLGRFKSPDEAHRAYLAGKAEALCDLASAQVNPDIAAALRLRAIDLRRRASEK